MYPVLALLSIYAGDGAARLTASLMEPPIASDKPSMTSHADPAAGDSFENSANRSESPRIGQADGPNRPESPKIGPTTPKDGKVHRRVVSGQRASSDGDAREAPMTVDQYRRALPGGVLVVAWIYV